jgi:hypothetical protein
MVIKINLTGEDYLKFKKEFYWEYKRTTKILWSVFLGLWFGMSFAKGHSAPSAIFAFVVFGGLFFAILTAVPYTIVVFRNKKFLAKAHLGELEITLFESGLSIVTADKEIFLKREFIKKVYDTSNYIGIILLDEQLGKPYKRLFVIPKHSFTTADETNKFLYNICGFAFKNANQVNGNYPYQQKYRPSYAIGFLGFIPLIGAINGIIMVVRGLSQYKDLKYTLIGLAGILFTVVVYGSLFYQVRYGAAFKQSNKLMAQDNLNGLVKSIEFYKLQHSHYPDSLRQINTSGFVFIYDSMDQSQALSKQTKLYYYKRIGNKYTLFSSGFDGKPYTNDDVFPTLNLSDTTKFGFVNDHKR